MTSHADTEFKMKSANARCSGNAPRCACPTIRAGEITEGDHRMCFEDCAGCNPGGDPFTMRANRLPKSRDGVRCDVAFQQEGGPYWRKARI